MFGSMKINPAYPDHEKDIISNQFDKICCSCEIVEDYRKLLGKENNETGKLLESMQRTSLCLAEEDSTEYIKLSDYESHHCDESFLLLIAVSSVSGIMLIAAIIVAIICAR